MTRNLTPEPVLDTTGILRALSILGFAPELADGFSDAKMKAAVRSFQRAKGLLPDGKPGPQTVRELISAIGEGPTPAPRLTVIGLVPSAWMPEARIERIIVHWTGGSHRASDTDRRHGHILIEVDGKLVRGTASIAANGVDGIGPVAEHMRDFNRGSIGVSLCCMVGAERCPREKGRAPMTALQWHTLADVLADLCRRYSIPVTRETVLFHAEIGPNLGLDRGDEWGITRLPFDPSLVGAGAFGDAMRSLVAARLRELSPAIKPMAET